MGIEKEQSKNEGSQVNSVEGDPSSPASSSEESQVSEQDSSPIGGAKETENPPNQATELVRFVLPDLELFHTPENDAYATIEVETHKETWALNSQDFRRWLNKQFYERFGGAPRSTILQDALNSLEAVAQFDGPTIDVFIRVASKDEKIYIDLTNDSWDGIEVTAQGWSVLNDLPVKFRRAKGMLALPTPAQSGSVDILRPLINVPRDEEWILLLGWLIQALFPSGPYIVLVLQGEQGSAKTTLARIIRALIDPNVAPLRSKPRSEQDLMIEARNGWVIAFDNVSYLSFEQSDAICRLSTGGAFSARKLYTDVDESLIDAQRPVVLNGIEEFVVRGDLQDRSVLLYLPTISANNRKPEEKLWADFEQIRPKIFGALLDALSESLSNLPSIQLPRLPRMADAIRRASAAESSLGLRQGAFLDAFESNQNSAHVHMLETSPIAQAIISLMSSHNPWTGTATELLDRLNSARPFAQSGSGWPRSPAYLSNQLRRLQPHLRSVGIVFDFDRSPNQRTIKITKN